MYHYGTYVTVNKYFKPQMREIRNDFHERRYQGWKFSFDWANLGDIAIL